MKETIWSITAKITFVVSWVIVMTDMVIKPSVLHFGLLLFMMSCCTKFASDE